MLTVELDVVTRCDGDTKNQTQIFEHSLAAGTAPNGEVLVTEQSPYGWSEEACWTTHQIEVNTDLLWKRNARLSLVFPSIVTPYRLENILRILNSLKKKLEYI